MTIVIAHRGLCDGPDSDRENLPLTIEKAREHGFDVEIDLWLANDRWFLGHDRPTTEIDLDWLWNISKSENGHHAWIHAKNIDGLHGLISMEWPGHVFFHDRDPVVLTNTGFLWTYPGEMLTDRSICLMPEWNDRWDSLRESTMHAVCTDYARKARSLIG